MKEKELNVHSAGGYARAAAIDARVKNVTNKSHYSVQQVRDVESAASTLEYLGYSGKFYVNFRKRFAAIKIENAEIKNKKVVKDLEKEYEIRGWEKRKTGQAIIYRIPRQAD